MNITRNNETKYLLLVILSICFLATGGILVKLSNLPPIIEYFFQFLYYYHLFGKICSILTKKILLLCFWLEYS